jgi:hypothetical protein
VPESRVLKWTDANLEKQKILRELHASKKVNKLGLSEEGTADGKLSGRKRSRDAMEDRVSLLIFGACSSIRLVSEPDPFGKIGRRLFKKARG